MRRQWAAFGEWGYERHRRWGNATLPSPESWAWTAALTLTALVLCIVGLDRHADLWDWMSGHRQAFFVLQSIAVLSLGLLCLWLLVFRPLTRRSAQFAAAVIALLFVAGLALLCDRANDALSATGATLLLTIAWRLTAMNTWGPHVVGDLIALLRRVERPPMPHLIQHPHVVAQPTPAAPSPDLEVADDADSDQSATFGQPVRMPASIQFNAWFVLAVGGLLLLIAAFTLPIFSVSLGIFGSASATLEELARLLEADDDGVSGGTKIAWQFGWGTIAYAALATAIGLVGWFNLARFHRSFLAILLVAGPVLLIIQLIGVVLLTTEAEAGSGLIVGTSGFWVNLIAFAATILSLLRLRLRSNV